MRPHLQSQYGNPMIYVTENGVSEKMLCTDLCDHWRVKHLKDYANELLKGELEPGWGGRWACHLICSLPQPSGTAWT